LVADAKKIKVKHEVMNKSESIKNLAKALVTFHTKVGKVGKDSTNPFFKSKYASLSNILEAINEPLIESGLTFCQLPSNENGLTTILMHSESGEFIESDYTMRPVKDDPQGKGSAITYQRRYALAAILGLNIDEDDDGNAASQNGKTNSYNRTDLKKSGLPLISNSQYKTLMDRVRKGDHTAGAKALTTFSFEPTQLKQLNEELQKQPA
jgi:hypothetical protein